VLLDEIAAGTDPVEGAALAEALLDRLATQARLTVTTSHFAELKEWASAAEGAANAATGIDPETNEPLYTVTLGRPGTSHALQTAERLGLPAPIVAAARDRIAPERLQVAELVAEAETAAREAQERLAAAAVEQEAAEAARLKAQRAAEGLQDEIEQVRSSAASERQRALAEAEVELAGVRAELEELRAEIRAARKLERERGRATTPAAQKKEAERDRRLGAASDRATRASRSLARLDEPLPMTGPLAAGDPVVAAELGVRGTLTEIVGDEATVLGRGGLRIRVPLDRLRPDRDATAVDRPPEPAVTVRAMIQNDLPDELDLRGRTAQEAREAVRDLVDAAALAGRAEVRVIHGRGTGAVRKAVRDELSKHPLVEEQESDSADGATVVRLGGGSGTGGLEPRHAG
jgi:DNA mismatch repair protein MutS2